MADITPQDQAEMDLLAELDEFSSLNKQIDRLIMKRSEMAARITAATANIKAGNEAIKAELQVQPDTDPEVTPAEEQAVIDLESVAADTAALGNGAAIAPVTDTTVTDGSGTEAPGV